MARTKANGSVTRSSGNVFADLGLPRAEERQTQVRLAVAINQVIKQRRLSQSDAGLWYSRRTNGEQCPARRA
ncbi:MAG TPA: XRE family transcriptional regulator [Pyrinomonadaceae bacterium]|nr:XRE family transcriptional regulator [Pyrinomonadaceae bacterium]